jgi:membrane-associated PAP2 superfamily phosphatase
LTCRRLFAQNTGMNRPGLIAALAVAVAVGLVFGLYPQLDLKVARIFFNDATNSYAVRGPLVPVRETAMWLIAALVAPAALALALKLIAPRRKLLIPGRAVVFLLVTLALGPGLVVNGILKDYWGRPRPVDVIPLGGTKPFVAWWDPRGTCPNNCSFVSGDVSGGFWTLAPAALAPPAWRAAAYTGAIVFASGIAVLRMIFGGHFFTDTVFAAVITFLIIWVMYHLLYRWPATRLSDDAIEQWLARAARPFRRSNAAPDGSSGDRKESG